MCEINKEDEAEEQEKHGANQGEVVTPNKEEALGDEESEDDQEQPGDDLWSPVPVLDGGAAVTSAVDANKDNCQDGVEDTERELNAVDSNETVALLAEARYREVVESQVLELLDRPGCEHDPREDAVDQKYQGVRDPRSGAGVVLAFEDDGRSSEGEYTCYCISRRRYRALSTRPHRNMTERKTRPCKGPEGRETGGRAGRPCLIFQAQCV